MRSVSTKVCLTVAVIALLAGACSSGGGDSTGSGGSSESGDSTGSGGSSESGELATSPLGELLGQTDDLSSAQGQAEFAEEWIKREEEVAACMRAQGFEYIPVNNSDLVLAAAAEISESDMQEFTQEFGFGISTREFAQDEVGPDLIGYVRPEFSAAPEPDPNEEIVEAMDEPTKEAYFEALYGPAQDLPVLDEPTSEDEQAVAGEDVEEEPPGCIGEAPAADSFYRDFADELEDLNEVVDDDPRVVEVQQEISECIAKEGIALGAYTSLFDVYGEFEAEVQEIRALVGGNPIDDLTEEQLRDMTDQELQSLLDKPLVLTDEVKTKLAEVQEREVRYAIVFTDCGFQGEEFETVYQEVFAEYEQRFIEDNVGELEKYEPASG